MKKWFLDTLFAIAHPTYWVRIHRTSKELDKWFNKEMKKGTKFENIYYYNGELDNFKIKFANQTFWIANIPYACFIFNSTMPKRRTVYKLLRLLEKNTLEEEK